MNTSESTEQDKGGRAVHYPPRPLEKASKPQFRLDQIRIIRTQMRHELVASGLILLAMLYVLWPGVPMQTLGAWSAAAALSLLWRSLFVSDRYANRNLEDVCIWPKGYTMASAISGTIWGSIGAILLVNGSEHLLGLTMLALTCVSLSAFTAMQSSPVTYATFAIPLLAPTAALLALSGPVINKIIALLPLVSFSLMHSSSSGLHALLAKSIRLSSHNSELIKKLVKARENTDAARQRAEVANRELQEQVEERRRAEDQIREAKDRIQAIFEGMQDTMYQVDGEGLIKWVTPSIRQLLGYDAEELIGQPACRLFKDQESHEKHREALDSQFGRLQHYETEMRQRNGDLIWVSENATYRYNEIGGLTGYESTLRDITPLKKTKEALYLAQEQVYVTLGSIGDGVIAVSLDGTVDYMNAVAEQGTGWRLEEAHGQSLHDIFRILDEKTLQPVPDPVELCLDEGKSTMLPGYLLLMHRHLNQRISIEVNASPIRNSDQEVCGVVLVFHDVSELRSLAQMTYHATHDSLTSLINRREFEKRVNQAMDNARDKDTRYALCYLDLDNFKIVNDTCGHVAGDELLKQLSIQLRTQLREGDTLSRIGGDEFGVLYAGCSIAAAKRLAEKLRQVVDRFRFAWDDKSFRVGASIGLVPVTAESGSLSDILSAADSACYVAKENGRNRIHVYETNDTALVEEQGQMQWVHKIQEILEQDRFELYFQKIEPIQPNRDEIGKLHGEVLIRIRDEDGTVIGPGSFLPAAERYSLMPAIDRWVVEHALAMLSRDIEHVSKHISACSINLSGQSLSDDRFMNTLIKMIRDTEVPAELLCFEITETAVISNLSTATELIHSLRDMGCSFALDDFGVGLSSFGYLKNLPVDYLKLDGCFIRNMTRDTIDHAMVQSINHIGQTMKIRTIAEFVEDVETLKALQQIGVDYAQGYQVGPPIALAEAIYGRTEATADQQASAG